MLIISIQGKRHLGVIKVHDMGKWYLHPNGSSKSLYTWKYHPFPFKWNQAVYVRVRNVHMKICSKTLEFEKNYERFMSLLKKVRWSWIGWDFVYSTRPQIHTRRNLILINVVQCRLLRKFSYQLKNISKLNEPYKKCIILFFPIIPYQCSHIL